MAAPERHGRVAAGWDSTLRRSVRRLTPRTWALLRRVWQSACPARLSRSRPEPRHRRSTLGSPRSALDPGRAAIRAFGTTGTSHPPFGVPAGGRRDVTCEHLAMGLVGGQHVEEAVAEMVAVLTPRADVNWRTRAGSLEWSCWQTAAHVAHDLASYAGQVAGRATAGYLPFDLVIAPEAAPREVLRVVSACGRLLSIAVASAGAAPVAWHWGMSDAAGFAAMGVAEALVHTYDIAQGLGMAWLPPEPLCELVVARLLPDSPPGRARGGPALGDG